MSEDTLNEKFWDAIHDNVYGHEDGNNILGTNEGANECEKICIQTQIDLLNKYIPIVAAAEIRTDGFICSHTMGAQVMDLTAKLKSIK